MTPRPASALALLLVAACAHPAAVTTLRPTVTVTPDAMQADSIANALVQRAFTADAAGETPDSLYAADAEIIANGEVRRAAPRFAGVGSDGIIQLSSSQIRVTGAFVWGTVEYRWLPTAPGQMAAEARATVVLGRVGGAWRMLHVHSSTVPITPQPAKPDSLDGAGRSRLR
ncbi:MAG TPA: nuclear transport factor 2 family protein [Gemmatimonadales bacterium]|jgi:hypothetical protein|nr:nuclear transport factor 2 family protein [Gemmatimonadales bacterium]